MDSATTTKACSVLSDLGLEKLSAGISLYEPAAVSEKDNGRQSMEPTLIILCSWAFAQPKHIAKYIAPYQSIYPAATILLVQNIVSNAIWWPDSWQWSFFQPAAAEIQQHLTRTRHPRVLVHAFSNGGSHAAVQLSETCREVCGGLRMPVDALILDSAPGIPRYGPTIKALTLGVPGKNPLVKAVGTVLAYVSVGWTAAMDILNIAEPAAWKLYRVLNDAHDVFLWDHDAAKQRAVPRAYIYSKADVMIMEEDVLGHADISRKRLADLGLGPKRAEDCICLEEFVGTAHVNHVKSDPDRYWNVVKETWKRSQIEH